MACDGHLRADPFGAGEYRHGLFEAMKRTRVEAHVFGCCPREGRRSTDPQTKAIQTYTGLNDPYSYSDMTGWGLQNAVIPQ